MRFYQEIPAQPEHVATHCSFHIAAYTYLPCMDTYILYIYTHRYIQLAMDTNPLQCCRSSVEKSRDYFYIWHALFVNCRPVEQLQFVAFPSCRDGGSPSRALSAVDFWAGRRPWKVGRVPWSCSCSGCSSRRLCSFERAALTSRSLTAPMYAATALKPLQSAELDSRGSIVPRRSPAEIFRATLRTTKTGLKLVPVALVDVCSVREFGESWYSCVRQCACTNQVDIRNV